MLGLFTIFDFLVKNYRISLLKKKKFEGEKKKKKKLEK